MQKKGQVTLFVIMGIVIVLLVGIGFYYRERISSYVLDATTQESVDVPIEVNQIEETFQRCINVKFHNALIDLGLYSGYLSPNKDALKTDSENVNYGYYKENKIRPIANVQDDVEKELKKLAIACLDTKTNLLVELKSFDSSVVLGDEDSSLKINYIIKVSAGDSVYNLKGPYSSKESIRFGKLNLIAKKIVDLYIVDPENIDVKYLLDLEMDVKVLNYDQNNLVYIIKDLKDPGDIYSYFFALKGGGL